MPFVSLESECNTREEAGDLMPNRWPKCDICLLRHRPEKCKGRVDLKELPALIANDCQSMRDLADRITSNMDRLGKELK